MKAKMILLFFICVNVVALSISFSCVEEGTNCGGEFNNDVIKSFFDIDATDNLATSTGALRLNETFESESSDLVSEQQSGIIAGITTGIASFLDPLKMVISILAFFTPIPFMSLMASLGVPTYISMFFIAPMVVMYIIGLAEFIKGGEL